MKNRDRIAIIAILATTLFTGICMAQQSNTLPANGSQSTNYRISSAIELYNNKFYQSALEILDKLAEQYNNPSNRERISIEEIEGYRLLCHLKLKVPGAEGMVNEYEKSYPHSPLGGKIKYNLALNFFNAEEYDKAGLHFESVNKRTLDKRERDGYNFMRGYCKMRSGKTDEALNLFAAITHDNSSAYINPASYYCGYIHYINRDFKKAIPFFERSKNDARFEVMSRYHLLESNFLLKNYDYVIACGEEIYQAIENNYKSNVARIISEAYYASNDTEKAKYYFELYSMSGKGLNRTDNFYAGMISYTLGNYISAADAFKKIASANDSIGQIAAYHMGESHIRLKNKHAAQRAFKMASESNFDNSIKEDAFFNYAKLSFDINRDMTPFNEYLNLYTTTNSKWDEIHLYIATGFLLNNNYKEAVEALKKIRNATPETTVLLQKASFFRAIRLIRNGSYTKALPHLEESVRNSSYNLPLKNLAQFWLAECNYRRDDFDIAGELLMSLHKSTLFRKSSEYPASHYNLGYIHFKKGNYQEAINSFNNYLGLGHSEYQFESRLRIADSHFMLKQYDEAAKIYELAAVEDNYNNLYAPFQAALSYGLLNNSTKKCALLEEITSERHKESPLYSNALYELARTYTRNVEDEKATEVLQKLIENPQDSTFYTKALLEMGMISANRKEYSKALDYYKTIIIKSPVSEEAQSALSGIENIYQSQNRTEEFLQYLSDIGMSATKSEDEKENMLFNSAEQIFLSSNYTDALDALNRFILRYPDGNNTVKAWFYIAECYNKAGKLEKSAECYHKVMESGEGSFAEISTLNYAQISYRLERYDEAIKGFETLDKIAVLGNNKRVAAIGKMESYYFSGDYRQSLIEAETIIDSYSSSGGGEGQIKELARSYKLKSLIRLGRREEAVPLMAELSKDKSTAIGAEAAYILIHDAYDAGEFEKVEQETFAFAQSGTPESYWLAKAFIILGDSYADRENFEQAEATFNSIKENYTPSGNDDIGELLKIRLDKLAKIMAAKNSNN